MTIPTTGPAAVRVRVPAKINLGLSVGPVGSDGYHPLATLFQAVSLYDDIVVRPRTDGEIRLQMSGEGSESLPTDDTNLAVRAALLVRRTHGSATLGCDMTIRKGIPIAGGMAGGSADAAGALLACSVLWDLDLDPADLALLGGELGSDVPFGLIGGNALGTNRGERLTPALARGCYHWVLALADDGLSTPAVYRRFDELGLGPQAPAIPSALLQALAKGDPIALGAALHNDLQAPAVSLRPELQRTLDAGVELGALGALVSGSGPTCAFLAADESKAVDLSVALSAEGVCRTVRRVTGPSPGARLVS